MNDYDLKSQWKYEELSAFQGWDFSHIDGRWESGPLPWDYRKIVLSFLKSTDKLLDMGTGGGEFLLSLHHPFSHTAVTEAYPPNVALCEKRLVPLGISLAQTYDDDKLPFKNNSFDIVINRQESFDAAEVGRVLTQGGYFITQQVGGENNRDLSQRLIKGFAPRFPKHTLENNIELLRKAGFRIQQAEEAFPPVRFFDVGALVYFAKIIEWEFPGFSVDTSFDGLCQFQREIDKRGFVQGTENRFLLVAQKI